MMGIVLRSGGVYVRVNVRFVWCAFVETERVDLVGIVLAQYEEMKAINELSERQLEAHFPLL